MAKRVAEGSPYAMQCLLEKLLLSIGFEVVHDGSLANEFPNAGPPSFFTRTLRWRLDGKPVDTWVRFKYNLRSGDADLTISHKDLIEIERRLNEQLGAKGKSNSIKNGTTHIREKDRKDDSSPASKTSSPDVEASRTSPIG